MADDLKAQNPLLGLRKYTTKYILTAFSTTSDAVETPIDYTIGKSGTIFQAKGCGKKGVVVINEFTDKRFIVHTHTNEFNYHSFFDRSTTSMTGHITLTDGIGGYFQNFIRDQVSNILDVSQAHIIFNLRTYFIGSDYKDQQQMISVKPLIFHMYNLSNSFNQNDKANFYTISYFADYNTFGLMPNYSKLYQMTITHKNSNSHVPVLENTGSVKDKRKNIHSIRQTKLDNEKTMVTLKDLFDGFEQELKNAALSPESQIPSWMKSINDSYDSPFEPFQQKKQKGTLPIDYNIKLDQYYHNFVIDNRNLAFEQPEQSQLQPGIKSFQLKPGKFITKAVNTLMKLSTQVGMDAHSDKPIQKSYKSNISSIKTCDTKYQFDMSIKTYNIPKNDGKTDTGPGEGSVDPLKFTYQKDKFDIDILSMHMSLFADSELSSLQEKSNTNTNHAALSKEPIVLERNANEDFFKSAYSGLRAMSDPKNYGLENPIPAVSIDNTVKTNLVQTSTLFLSIIGNPNLLSDIFRNPISVSNEDYDKANYYKYPEYYPMYAYLDIYLKPASQVGLTDLKDIPIEYYYKGYYHIGKISTTIMGSLFTQELELYRTDDNI